MEQRALWFVRPYWTYFVKLEFEHLVFHFVRLVVQTFRKRKYIFLDTNLINVFDSWKRTKYRGFLFVERIARSKGRNKSRNFSPINLSCFCVRYGEKCLFRCSLYILVHSFCDGCGDRLVNIRMQEPHACIHRSMCTHTHRRAQNQPGVHCLIFNV